MKQKRNHRAISMKAWRVRKQMAQARRRSRDVRDLLPCPDYGADIKRPSRPDKP